MTKEQISAIANQFVILVVKHGGVMTNKATGEIKFPSKKTRKSFEDEYMAAPKVV